MNQKEEIVNSQLQLFPGKCFIEVCVSKEVTTVLNL